MLILSRRIGESVVIGEDIYCTLLGVQGGQVRLGFDAPTEIPVNRNEIHERIIQDRQYAKPANDETTSDLPIIERLIARFKNKTSII